MSKFCSNCGNELVDGADVCTKCGKMVSGNANNSATSGKSKIAAALLALFLGTFGAHNFYLGYTGKAVTQLVLTIIGYFTLILIIGAFFIAATGIWAFIEFIMILVGGISVDAQGNKLV